MKRKSVLEMKSDISDDISYVGVSPLRTEFRKETLAGEFTFLKRITTTTSKLLKK